MPALPCAGASAYGARLSRMTHEGFLAVRRKAVEAMSQVIDIEARRPWPSWKLAATPAGDLLFGSELRCGRCGRAALPALQQKLLEAEAPLSRRGAQGTVAFLETSSSCSGQMPPRKAQASIQAARSGDLEEEDEGHELMKCHRPLGSSAHGWVCREAAMRIASCEVRFGSPAPWPGVCTGARVRVPRP